MRIFVLYIIGAVLIVVQRVVLLIHNYLKLITISANQLFPNPRRDEQRLGK